MKKQGKRALMALAALIVAVVAWGYDFTINPLATQSQLPVSNTFVIFQDSYGYMWYGTIGGGLCRDNGYQLDVMRPSECSFDTRADNVLCFMEDANQNIWFGTDAGVFRIDRNSMQMTMPHDIKDYCMAMLKAADDTIYVAADNRILVLTPDGSKIAREWKNSAGERVCRLHQDSQGNIFAFFGKELWVVDNATRQFRLFKRFEKEIPNFMEESDGGGYWLTTRDHGVVHLAPDGTVTPQPVSCQSADQSHCISMLIDRKYGFMWVNNYANLDVYQIEGNTLHPIDTTPYFGSSLKILGVASQDRQGNIWVPSFIPHTFVVNFQKGDSRRVEVPEMNQFSGYPLIPDRMVVNGNNAWIHQGRMGLLHYDISSGQLTDIGGEAYGRALTIDKKARGIYAPKGNELMFFSFDKPKEAQFIASFPAKISAVSLTNEGDVLVGTRLGVSIYSPSTGKTKNLAVCGHRVMDVAKNGNKIYFLLQEKGLYSISMAGNSEPAELIANPFLEDLAASFDGTVWAAGRDGKVYKVKDGEAAIVPEMCNQHHEPFADIVCDMRGHVWTLTNQSVKEYNTQTYSFRTLNCDHPDIKASYFYCFEEAEGDSVAVCGPSVFCVLPSSIALDREASSEFVPRVTSLAFGDSVIVVGGDIGKVELEPDQTMIEISVSTLDIPNSSIITFAYCLNGGQQGWVTL